MCISRTVNSFLNGVLTELAQFITFATPRVRLVLGYMLLFPCIFLYKFGVISASKMRRMIVRIAFWRANQADVETLAEAFVKKRIPALMSVEMMVSLERHRQRGDRIVIVSGSLSVYLRHSPRVSIFGEYLLLQVDGCLNLSVVPKVK